MIRINLLGQARPKAAKKSVPLEATVQVLFAWRAGGALRRWFSGITYYQQKRQLRRNERENRRAASGKSQPAANQERGGPASRAQKAVLQQRIDVIETLQRNRTGGQELLETVANTVVRVDELWLTSMDASGNALRHGRRSGFDQRRGQFHHAVEAFRILRQGGDQGQRKRTTW